MTRRHASLAEAFERVDASIAAIAAERRDVALSAALAADDPWRPVIANGLSLASSADVEETSLLDTAFYRNTDEDYPVEQGLGTLVATIAAGLPVTLSTPVSAIDWSGRRALVRTAAGESVGPRCHPHRVDERHCRRRHPPDARAAGCDRRGARLLPARPRREGRVPAYRTDARTRNPELPDLLAALRSRPACPAASTATSSAGRSSVSISAAAAAATSSGPARRR